MRSPKQSQADKEQARQPRAIKTRTDPAQATGPGALVRQATAEPGALSPEGALQLQRLVGNRAVQRLLKEKISPEAGQKVQRTGSPSITPLPDGRPPRLQAKLVHLQGGYVALDEEEESIVNDGDLKYKIVSQDANEYVLEDNWGELRHYPKTQKEKAAGAAKTTAASVEQVRSGKANLEKDARGLVKQGVWYYSEWSDEAQHRAEGKQGIANAEYFSIVSNIFVGKQFKIKPGKSPAEAINTFLAGPTVCDCGTFKNAVMYKSVLEALGAEKFNSVFTNKLVLEADPGPANPAMKYYRGLKTGDRVEPGDVGYFKNHPCYPYVHPEGVGDGWHVVCVDYDPSGEPLWAGLGLDHPMTADGVLQVLTDDYNSGGGVDFSVEKNARDLATRLAQIDVGAASKNPPKINDIQKIPKTISTAELNASHPTTQQWMKLFSEKTPPGFVRSKHKKLNTDESGQLQEPSK